MRRTALAAAILFLATARAQAHTVFPGMGGFSGGLLHPLLVPAHALTLTALGLLAGTMARRTQALLLAAFAVSAIAAFAFIAMAYSATQAETLMLCLGAAIGLLLAANLRPPVPICAALVAATASALLFDSVPPVPSVRETTLALTGTVLSAIAILAAAAWLSGALPRQIRSLGIRIAGSWIAASAIMVLALRLALKG